MIWVSECPFDHWPGKPCACAGSGMHSVISRATEDIHIQQLPHGAGIFEKGLPFAMVSVGFTHISGQKFATTTDFITNSRNEMLGTTSAQKIEIIITMLVFFSNPST